MMDKVGHNHLGGVKNTLKSGIIAQALFGILVRLMARFRLSLKSAQGQLVWTVFVPIVLLAMVGAFLMVVEVRHAVKSEQNAIARASLVHYEALVRPMLADVVAGRKRDELLLSVLPHDALEETPIFSMVGQSSHANWLRRVVVMTDDHKVLMDTGLPNAEALKPQGTHLWRQQTTLGTAFGTPMVVEGRSFWLLVEFDRQPLTIIYYRTVMILLVAGSLTLLFLLIILGAYSRRWILPVYELRMYLQHLTVDNLLSPPQSKTDGEFKLLYRDLTQANRRLWQGFDELKTQLKETEKSLDDMEERAVVAEAHSRDMISLSQSKSAFLANISHELRTPLNSIDGFINLLSRQQGLSSEQTLYIQTIKKSSAHLLALVNDVLDFSKMEAGKLVLENHEFDLYAIIYEVVDMLAPSALEKHLRLCVLVYNDVPSRVVGDDLRVKQILTNLVGNAIKFTDSGGVVVKVGLADKDGFLHISVEDTGKGISDSDKEQLFKSFGQGDLSITRRYGGTGLGLVISKQLVHQMGGAIGFWDNASHNLAKTGATFWFEIPTGDTDECDKMQCLPNLSSPLKLLVWINHDPTLKMLKASLAGTQTQIHFAIGFADLLEQLDKPNHGFDWVMVDYFGQDASLDDVGAILRQIRSRYQGRLATYGYQMGMDMQMLEEYQADALYEPMDKRQLYALLANERPSLTTKNTKPFSGKRVLIVDDYASNRLVAEAFLVELGAEVVQANSGFGAIELMTKAVMGEHLPIDLILMDIQMPRMSGLEASLQIRKIQESHHKPAVPIIALTAHGLADEKSRLVKAGMDDYASKPVSLEKLTQLLEKWLGSSKDLITPQASPPKEPTVSLEGQSKTLDWQDALERAGSRIDLAKTLLQTVVDSADKEKHALEQAWANRDRKELADIAHRLVGASRYTGVPYLRQTSEHFEKRCREDIANVSDGQFVSMRPTYRRLIDALDDLSGVVIDEWLAQNNHGGVGI